MSNEPDKNANEKAGQHLVHENVPFEIVWFEDGAPMTEYDEDSYPHHEAGWWWHTLRDDYTSQWLGPWNTSTECFDQAQGLTEDFIKKYINS